MKNYLRIIVLMVLCNATTQVHAANNHWINGVGGNWNTTSNWSLGVVPTASDTAVIDANGTYTVTVNVAVNCARIVVGGGSGIHTLYNSGNTITLNNGMRVVSGHVTQLIGVSITGTGTIINNGTLIYNSGCTTNMQVQNNDSMYLASSNTINAAINNGASGKIHLQEAQLFVNTSITNNGVVTLASSGCVLSYIQLNAGVFNNNASGTLNSNPNPACYGYNYLSGPLNNDGTINVNYSFYNIITSASSSIGGTVNIANGMQFQTQNGTVTMPNTTTINLGDASSKVYFNSSNVTNNGATINGPGFLEFYGATLAMNLPTDTLPNQLIQLDYTTLTSTNAQLIVRKQLRIISNNNINCNLRNIDSIVVRSSGNTINGAFTCATGSVLHFNAISGVPTLTFATAFTNNGKILMTSTGCYSATMAINSGALINPPAGIITIDPNPACYGYYSLNCGINNQGTININYKTYHTTTAAASTNSGIVNIAPSVMYQVLSGVYNATASGVFNFGNSESNLDIYSCTFNYTGSSFAGNGFLNCYAATCNMNQPGDSLPDIRMIMNSCVMNTSNAQMINRNTLTLITSNTVNGNFMNVDSVIVRSGSNSFTGTYAAPAGSVLYFNAINGVPACAFSNAFTNYGKILYTSSGCYTATMTINTGTLINAPGGDITINPNPACYGYYSLSFPINNQGTMNINYTTYWYSTAGTSINTGTINIGSGVTLGHYYGTINLVSSGTINFGSSTSQFNFYSCITNYTGPVINGSGTMYFESTVANMNVATLPSLYMTFYASTLASTFLPTTSIKKINLVTNNTISAAIFNTDTILVQSSGNVMNGALTTSNASLIWFNGLQGYSSFATSAGFTNNGKILFQSNGCNGTNLQCNSGNIINAPTGQIISNPGAGCYGYNQMQGSIINQGTINVNFNLYWILNSQLSENTGTININKNYQLYIQGLGTFDYNGGTIVVNGTGTSPNTGNVYYYNTTVNLNVPSVPDVFTFFDYCTIASNQTLLISNAYLQINYANTINANIQNNDTIVVSNNLNTYAGTLYTATVSLIWLNGQFGYSAIKFNNDLLNNGKIWYTSNGCNGTNVQMATGKTLTNSSGGIIHASTPGAGCYGYHSLTGSVTNNGTINVDYKLYAILSNGIFTNNNLINILKTSQLYMEGPGTVTFDSGNIQTTGSGTSPSTGNLYLYNLTNNYNVSPMHDVFTFLDYTTLNSTQNPLVNSTTYLQTNYSNTINANMHNNDTIVVSNNLNTYAGTLTNVPSSVLWLNGQYGYSAIKFDNSFTNNGRILYTSNGCNGTSLQMATGKTLTNTATGLIHATTPGAGCYGYHAFTGSIINDGDVKVDYKLAVYLGNGSFTNNNNINILRTSQLYLEGPGTATFATGNIFNTGTGTPPATGSLYMYNLTNHYNVSPMHDVFTFYDYATLNSTVSPLVNNNAYVQFNYSNTINANMRNADTVVVSHSNNTYTGNYSTTGTSLLWLNGQYSSSIITYNNNWLNKGKIDITSNGCSYTDIVMSPGDTLTNDTNGVVISNTPGAGCYGYHRLDGNFVNNGTLTLKYPLINDGAAFINNPTGIIKGNNQLTLVSSTLQNKGTLMPGLSPGTLTINGNIKNTSTAQWNVEIGGLSPSTQHDLLVNNFGGKTDSISGTLNISLINNFVPNLGDSVVIETHNARIGTFSNITGATIPGGLVWNVFYRPNHIALRAGNPPNLSITATSGPNGTILPAGVVSVVYNDTAQFSFLPHPGYEVDSVIVDGVFVDSASSYTFYSVVLDHTIHVTYRIITFPISASSTSGGTITPSGVSNVSMLTSQMYTIVPAPCFFIDSVYIDGMYIGAPTTYTFSNVVAPHTIHVVFSNAPDISSNGALTFCAGQSRTLDAGSGFIGYMWSNGATTQTTVINAGGTYTCTVTGTGGCTSSTSVNATVNPLPVVTLSDFYPADSNQVCINGNGTGYLQFSNYGLPAGGSYSGTGIWCAPYCYFSPTIAGIGTHTITYTYTDGNGCTSSDSIAVTVNPIATVDAGHFAKILCNTTIASLHGTYGGSATSVVWSTSGTGTFDNVNDTVTNYTLSPADTAAGIVVLTLSTNNPSGPCDSVYDIITLYYNPNAIADAGPSEACFNANSVAYGNIYGYGSVPVWTTSGTGTVNNPFDYNTSYTFSAADSAIGYVYLILTPTDTTGQCTFTPDSIKAWIDPAYSVDAGPTIVLCGKNNTTAQLAGSYLNAQQVTWYSNGTGTFSNVNSITSTYTLSSQDQSLGYVFLTLQSDDPAGPCNNTSDQLLIKYKYLEVAMADEICGDTITGIYPTVDLNALSFGTSSFQYSTSGTGTFSNQSFWNIVYHASHADIAAGHTTIYLQPIDNQNECTYASDSIVIWYNPHYAVDAGPDTVTICANDTVWLNGTMNITPTAVWSTSGSGTFDNDTALATYYVPSQADTAGGTLVLSLTSADPAGPCVAMVDNILIHINPLPNASAGTNSPVCYGNDLNITASGGINYLWSGPAAYSSTLQNIIRTPAYLTMNGTYTVTVTDNKGCSATATTVADVQICGCIVPQLAVFSQNVLCHGNNTGFIVLTINTPGAHSFLWSNGSTNQNQLSLTAGTYTVTVTNIPGCDTVITVGVTQPTSPLTGSCSSTNATCYNAHNGTLYVVASGGTSPYTYFWNDGNTLASRTGIAAGTYTATVTDDHGCTTSCSTVISQPLSQLVANCLGTNVSCGGASDGSVNANVVGGTSPYQYLWSSGATTSTVTGLPQATYTVTVTDAAGCTTQCGYQVQSSNNLLVQLFANNVSCSIPFSGSIISNVSGGVAPYTYLWSNGATTTNLVGINTGTYTLTVTDISGCTRTALATVSNGGTAPVQPGLINGVSPVCRASNANTFSVAPVPGATSYLWTVSTGGTIMTGQGTTAVSIAFSNTANAGIVTVVAKNACGNSISRVFKYSVIALPATPAIIYGPTHGLCNVTNRVYSTTAINGATSYFWTVPAGATLVSGQGTLQIAVNFPGNFTSGQIKVRAVNTCGMSPERTYNVVGKPAQPKIIGSNTTCMYQQGVAYAVTPVPGATTYTWTIVAGSTLVSGQGTPSIVVNWGGINGIITCRAYNACGQSILANHPVSFTCTKQSSDIPFSQAVLIPNPTHNMATLSFESFVGNIKANIQVYNTIGAIVLSTTYPVHEGYNTTAIDASTLAAGTYIIKINVQGTTQMLRLMVE